MGTKQDSTKSKSDNLHQFSQYKLIKDMPYVLDVVKLRGAIMISENEIPA